MKQILFYLIGTQNYYEFFVGLFFLFLGIFVSLMMHANTRSINSSRTPLYFSWRFLLSDNVKRLMFSVLTALILYRFSGNILPSTDKMLIAFIIGFSFDKAAQILREKFNLLKQ